MTYLKILTIKKNTLVFTAVVLTSEIHGDNPAEKCVETLPLCEKNPLFGAGINVLAISCVLHQS